MPHPRTLLAPALSLLAVLGASPRLHAVVDRVLIQNESERTTLSLAQTGNLDENAEYKLTLLSLDRRLEYFNQQVIYSFIPGDACVDVPPGAFVYLEFEADAARKTVATFFLKAGRGAAPAQAAGAIFLMSRGESTPEADQRVQPMVYLHPDLDGILLWEAEELHASPLAALTSHDSYYVFRMKDEKVLAEEGRQRRPGSGSSVKMAEPKEPSSGPSGDSWSVEIYRPRPEQERKAKVRAERTEVKGSVSGEGQVEESGSTTTGGVSEVPEVAEATEADEGTPAPPQDHRKIVADLGIQLDPGLDHIQRLHFMGTRDDKSLFRPKYCSREGMSGLVCRQLAARLTQWYASGAPPNRWGYTVIRCDQRGVGWYLDGRGKLVDSDRMTIVLRRVTDPQTGTVTQNLVTAYPAVPSWGAATWAGMGR